MHPSHLSRSIRSLAMAMAAGLLVLSLATGAQAKRSTSDTNCTRSNGYWGTHSSFGPSAYDPTWANIGEGTVFFLSGLSYYQVMVITTHQHPYYILAVQYIAAALNAYQGAEMPSDVAAAFIDATSLFQAYAPTYDFVSDPEGVTAEFEELENVLKLYNRGRLGPGSCKR